MWGQPSSAFRPRLAWSTLDAARSSGVIPKPRAFTGGARDLARSNIKCPPHGSPSIPALVFLTQRNPRKLFIRSNSASSPNLNTRSLGCASTYPNSAINSPFFTDKFPQPITRSRHNIGNA